MNYIILYIKGGFYPSFFYHLFIKTLDKIKNIIYSHQTLNKKGYKMNKRLNMILNSIEASTLVDWNLLLEDREFKKLFLQLFNDKTNDDRAVISQSIEYVNNNY